MTKLKLYIIVSKDFQTMHEATEFGNTLLNSSCGFYPIIKQTKNAFVVCRQYRPNDPADSALYLSDGEECNDGEPLTSWIHMEHAV